MIRTYYKPPIFLKSYIDRYWLEKSEEGDVLDLFPSITGTGIDLFIHFDAPFLLGNQPLANSHIVKVSQKTDFTIGHNFNFIVIRFKSGAFRHFCNINFNELEDNFLSLTDIWKQEGRDLYESLAERKSTEERLLLLNTFLTKMYFRYRKDTILLDDSILKLYKQYNDISPTILANEMNISLRHFERIFKQEFGLSPKKFQSLARFGTTIKKILLSSTEDYLQVALENGYYDQSHFIRECKALSSFTPSYFIKERNNKQHFYFDSIIW